MKLNNEHVTISAAGQATRIRSWMHEAGFAEGTPKSALPTGAGESLIGRITRQAMPLGRVAIYGNYDTVRGIGEVPDLPRDIDLLVNRNVIGPLGPIYLDALRTEKQSYMAAADFWADFSWEEFRDFHNEHGKPVSILVAPSVAAKSGARFNLADDGATVENWERVDETTEDDLINIGAYIIDGQSTDINQILRELNRTTHKEDPFNDVMIAKGAMAAFIANGKAFNANNGDVYEAMREYSASKPVVLEPASPNPIDFAPNAP
ncbi:MAG: hypothetical protein EOT05_04235 [Candidatus Microsaccharimonas sossegonensis]|uniref:Uncharacterized protein n=1 Tax=Candidatus Microsaccharimonas sossegonensis TaxID=2506948 RepID=A0A4Q0AI90_9BACT|nr:MAG: hypothetical protein EOT05_04235 [Candidatus Microsaccharimonas sossegonensis]